MLELRGLTKRFGGKTAVRDFDLEVADDEYVTLLGPSGAGKSTLLRLIAGLEQPDSGSITLDGELLTDLPAHLRGLGFVQQKYGLFPHMSVAENIGFGLRYRQIDPVVRKADLADRVDKMLDMVGLCGLGGRMVGEISGGQRQRVSLARTLICQPRICLLDEPLGALDANLRERMTVELRRLRKTLGVSFLHVTGNENEALSMGDRMIVLDRGKAQQIDTPDTVFHRPANVQVARFLNAYNVFTGYRSGAGFHAAGGILPMPSLSGEAVAYAVRFDRVHICAPDVQFPHGHGRIDADYIASEFLGGRVIHFFRGGDGSIIEAQQNLRAVNPAGFRQDQQMSLCWQLDDVLLFGANGQLIEPEYRLEAVQ